VRVGLLGGTFNPPHVGHLVLAAEARDQLGLERVLLVPVHTPPHKEAPGDPGPGERLALCRAAVAGEEGLAVDDLEVRRGGASYTVDTLRALRAARPDDELTFLVGGDQALGLPSWREPREVVALARLGVAEREGVRRQDIAERLADVVDDPGRIAFFSMPRIDVSSSMLRARLRDGRPVRHLVPDAVLARIDREGLYR
jgi:nicotinate-nucleotide adenylyltransferase